MGTGTAAKPARPSTTGTPARGRGLGRLCAPPSPPLPLLLLLAGAAGPRHADLRLRRRQCERKHAFDTI